MFFRGRTRVGWIWFWTILLIISAIVAPLIGEIGTPIGIYLVATQLLLRIPGPLGGCSLLLAVVVYLAVFA